MARKQISSIHAMYLRSANHGVVLGLYLTVLFLTMVAGVTNPSFSIVILLLMCGVPFIVYKWLRKTFCIQNGLSDFSALWMEGIATFIFGGLLSSFFSFVYMQAIDPHFIETIMRASIEAYRQNPWQGGEEFATVMQAAVDQQFFPSAISLTVDALWMIVFTGSLLSMLMALLVRMRPVKNSVN
ncbi:MAG: DUF4199 domain-containing protein [Muribaculum sp.]|nr:DUF4199 domain-containing protein [Muribaculaceae bacterium]MCM1081620.1 DUF4199 domain-containing protein [Muribaculum sp.]